MRLPVILDNQREIAVTCCFEELNVLRLYSRVRGEFSREHSRVRGEFLLFVFLERTCYYSLIYYSLVTHHEIFATPSLTRFAERRGVL